MGEVVEVSRTDLCDPNVHLSLLVRQEGHELAVGGDGGGLLRAIEVHGLELGSRDGTPPEVVFGLQQKARTGRQRHGRGQRQEDCPSGEPAGFHRGG